jgi:glutamate-1-semialdehyde-2,1-aminomutase
MSTAESTVVKEGTKAQEIRDKLVAMTRRSAEVHASSAEVLAQEVVPTVEMPHPIYIESAYGGHMTDVDGNCYIDLTMGFGPHVLGIRPQVVADAIKEQADKGWHFGVHNPMREELGRLLVEAAPCADSVIFCNSGTEATMYAMRAARAFTGKPVVALFDGSYHGAHDYALIKPDMKSSRSRPTAKILGSGVPETIRDDTMMVLPYRDETAFEIIREYKDQLALVIIEPVQSSNPRLDTRDFLHGLLEVCRECDVLFMLDEVITGFRIAYGGCQEYYDIIPDLATYGKALGGGLPIGAVAGRREVMATFEAKKGGIFSGGTFSGNSLTMAAGIAVVRYMRDHKDEIYPYLMEQGNRFTSAINEFCMEHQMAAQVMNAGSMFHMHMQGGVIDSHRDVNPKEHAVAEREFYLHLLGRGVVVPGIHLAFFCTAHTPKDVDTVTEAFKESFVDVRADGLI